MMRPAPRSASLLARVARAPVRLAFLLALAVATGPMLRAENFGAAFSQYEERPKNLSDLDWGLFQVMSHYKGTNNLSYNSDTRLFEAVFYESVRDVSGSTPEKLEDSLNAKIRVLNFWLGKYFAEYKKRGAVDLRASFILGRRGRDLIALYDGKKLSFTDDYYSYLREIGLRL